MRGTSDRKVFQESILNILTNAGVCKPIELNIPSGRKTPRSETHSVLKKADNCVTNTAVVTKPANNTYNPMKIFRERLASLKAPGCISYDRNTPAFMEPRKPSLPSSQQPPSQSSRPTVIKPSAVQQKYLVPVSNFFDILGN